MFDVYLSLRPSTENDITPYTLETIRDELASLSDHHDRETAHLDADGLILEALRILGAGDIAVEWEAARSRVGFWYS